MLFDPVPVLPLVLIRIDVQDVSRAVEAAIRPGGLAVYCVEHQIVVDDEDSIGAAASYAAAAVFRLAAWPRMSSAATR